ncbi:hypothetical protein ACWEWK_23950 [Streptomyces sp. NPDC003757]
MSPDPRPRRGAFTCGCGAARSPAERQRPTWHAARPALAAAPEPTRAAAGRLRRDDLAHAERRGHLRARGRLPG